MNFEKKLHKATQDGMVIGILIGLAIAGFLKILF